MSKHPNTYTIEIMQGATWYLTLKQYTTKARTTRKPFTAGTTCKMEIKEGPNGKTHLTLSNGSGMTLTEATGQIDIVMTATQTAAMKFTKAYYDIVITASTVKKCLLAGEAILKEAVTT